MNRGARNYYCQQQLGGLKVAENTHRDSFWKICGQTVWIASQPCFNVRRLLLLGILACVSFVSASGQSPEMTSLVENIISAYGEVGRVLSVKNYRLEGTIQAHTRGESGQVLRIVEGPDRLKVMLGYPSRPEFRILQGNKGWRGRSPQALEFVQGPMLASMTLQAARLRLPWILYEMQTQVVLAQTGGVVVLEISLGEGLKLRAFLDENTHRVMKAESVLVAGPMNIRFLTQYSDFREVDGILFPFREENFTSGIHAASTTIHKIKLDPSENELEFPFFPQGPSGEVAASWKIIAAAGLYFSLSERFGIGPNAQSLSRLCQKDH